MKEIKGIIFPRLMWIIASVVLGGIILNKYNERILFSVIVEAIILVFGLIVTIPGLYYFAYDKQRILIKNSLKPNYQVEYNISDIQNIQIIISVYLGLGVKIYFSDGRKTVFHTNVPRRQLKMMISETIGVISKK